MRIIRYTPITNLIVRKRELFTRWTREYTKFCIDVNGRWDQVVTPLMGRSREVTYPGRKFHTWAGMGMRIIVGKPGMEVYIREDVGPDEAYSRWRKFHLTAICFLDKLCETSGPEADASPR